MTAPPLTHHDIIRRAAPLTKSGFKVNLQACDRAARYIEFEVQRGDDESVTVIHALDIAEDGQPLFTRILVHECGLVSTLTAVVTDMQSIAETFLEFPQKRQIDEQHNYVNARSYTLEPDRQISRGKSVAKLRFACAHVCGVELRIDTSTGGGMPAEVRMLAIGKTSSYLRETLADGSIIPLHHRAAHQYRLTALEKPLSDAMPKIPDDILAVLGAQWRPLRFQGDHWKGVLRQLSKLEQRTTRAEKFIDQALNHLHRILNSPPERYHVIFNKARWRVYFRRLQPVMVFVGILAMMPISWLLVSSGTMTLHPLALGLTPLLMVGVVVLTAREIPVMEIPAKPAALSSSAWSVNVSETHDPNADQAT